MQVPRESGDNLPAYYVWPVVASGINPPPDRPLPCQHSNAALSSPGTGRTRLRTSHIVAEMIMGVLLRLYFRLGPVFHRPDGLRQPEAPAVLYVKCPDGNTRWELGLTARRWWHRVQAVGALGDWLGKGKWHPCRKQKYKTCRTEKPSIFCCRIYG